MKAFQNTLAGQAAAIAGMVSAQTKIAEWAKVVESPGMKAFQNTLAGQAAAMAGMVSDCDDGAAIEANLAMLSMFFTLMLFMSLVEIYLEFCNSESLDVTSGPVFERFGALYLIYDATCRFHRWQRTRLELLAEKLN